MRQRCKGTVNTDSVKVIKVNQHLHKATKNPERTAKESLTGAFFQQKPDGSAFSESKGSSGHGGSTCQVVFFVFGEIECRNARAILHICTM